MATIAKLVLQIEADTRSLRQTLGGATRAVNTFARDIDKSFQKIPTLATLGGSVGNVLQQRLGAVRKEFEDTVKDLRAQLKGKFIDRDQFANEMQSAIRAARDKAVSATRELQGIGLLDASQANAIVRTYSAAGRKSGEAFVAGNRNIQRADRLVTQLERDFQTANASARIARAMGGSSRREFEQAGRENAAVFNVGLTNEIQRLAASGKLTEPLRRALSTKFKPEGFGVGVAATAEEQSLARAQRAVDVLQRRFESTVAVNRDKLAKGLISPEAFERRAFEAAQRFDRALATAATRMRGNNALGQEAERVLSGSFKTIGRKNADAGVFAAREYVATFRDEYNRAIQTARFASLSGQINKREFKQAQTEAATNLATGIRQVRDRLNSEGLLTPQAIAFLNKQFSTAGTTSAKSFFEAFDIAMTDSSVRSLSRLGTLSTQVGTTLTKFLTLPLVGVGGASLKLAADAEQAQKRLEQVFGPLSADLGRELNKLQRSIPATSGELRSMAARLGELFIPLKIAPEAVAKMSIEMIKAAKNVSVFAGVSTERAMNAVINALVGQSRELKKLGVEIDDRSIRDEAYRAGIARVGAQLSTTQKVMAGYSVILQRVGIISNTVDSQINTFNVRMLFFTARLKEAGISLGNALLPTLTRVVTSLTNMVDRFAALTPETQRTLLIFGGLAAVLGPVLVGFGALVRSIALVRASMLAISLMTGGKSTGLATLLGISGGTLTFLSLGAALIIGLSIALAKYTDKLGDFKGLSAEFVRSLKEMSEAELIHANNVNRIERIRVTAQREALQRQAGIKELPGGFLIGGTIQQRQEFIKLGEQLKQIQAESDAINREWTSLDAEQIRLAGGAENWGKRIKAAQDAVSENLLVEVLARARIELNNLNRAAADAKRTLGAGLKLQNIEMITRGTEGAEKAISDLGAAVEDFNRQAQDPNNAEIAKNLRDFARDAKSAQDALRAFLAQNADTKVLKEFGARLAEIRKQLDLGGKTSDTVLLSAAFGNMASLQEEVQKAIDKAALAGNEALRARLNAISLEIDLLRKKFNDFLPAEFLKRIDATRERLRALRETGGKEVITSTGIPIEQFGEADTLIQQLQRDLQKVNAKIVEESISGRPINNLLREQREIMRDINDATPNIFERMFGKDFLPRIQEAADALKTATATEETAKLAGDVKAASQARLQIIRAQAEFAVLRAEFQRQIAGLSAPQQAQALRGFDEAFKKAGGSAGDTADKIGRVSRRILQMQAVVSVIRQVAELFGNVSENINKAIQSAGTLVDNLERLRTLQQSITARTAEENARRGATNPFASPAGPNFEESIARLSAVVGIVASTINLVRSIVGAFSRQPSPIEQEHNEIVRQNSERLAEATSALRGFTASIGNQLRVAQALGDPRVIGAALQRVTLEALRAAANSGISPGDVTRSRQNLEQELARFGLTFADINRIAKENGIQILDSKGRLVAAAFDQLVQSIAISREAFFKWSDTLDEAQKKQELFNNVFNVPDTGQQQVEDQLRFLSQFAPTLFDRFFKNVDLTNVTQVEAALQALTQAFLSGALETDATLKLLNKDELIAIITGVAGGLDKLREATNDVTESMLNVPNWFKVAQVRFESADQMITPSSSVPFTPSVPTPPLGPGQSKPSETTASIAIDNFNIIQQPGESSEDLAARVVSQLRRDRFMRTGSTRLPGFDE